MTLLERMLYLLANLKENGLIIITAASRLPSFFLEAGSLVAFSFCDISLAVPGSALEFFLLDSVLGSKAKAVAKLLRRDPATLADSPSLVFYFKNKASTVRFPNRNYWLQIMIFATNAMIELEIHQ